MTFKAYRVLAFAGLSLNAGAIVALFDHQAKPRAHALEPFEAGGYRVTRPIEFKAGEVVGLPDDISRALAAKLEPVDFETLVAEERAKLAALEEAIAKTNAVLAAKAETAPAGPGLEAPPSRRGKGGK